MPLLVEGEKDAVRIDYVMDGEFDPITGAPPPLVPKEVPALQNVNYPGMVPYLNAGWQHHDQRITDLEAALQAALDRIAALEAS